jgi:acyl-coenzyme A synthetase/AMP-(fatty) acid ligase
LSRPSASPLWVPADPQRPIAWRDGRAVTLSEFAQQVAALANALPVSGAMINLCEERYRFLVAYAAAQTRRHTVLLPPSRAEQIISEVEEANAGSYRCGDAEVDAALARGLLRVDSEAPLIPGDHVCMIGFTSGSTGQPKAYPKLWRTVNGSNAANAGAMRGALQSSSDRPLSIVATVPSQHMYGMELTVLLPLIGGMAVHAGRPLFPADIADALREIPEPRVLVSTPVHLRAIVESDVEFPRVALSVSATAPLDAALAERVERKLGGKLLEMFGSTETCVFAHRRTALESQWRLYDGVQITPREDSSLVSAPWFVAPITLQDVVELDGRDRFVVRGRNTDMIEIAGKRASLAELTRRLLAIEGVKDAVVFQSEVADAGTIRRVVALVVAPAMGSNEVLTKLAPSVDPAFMPRPLIVVGALPRNELGKIPREALMKCLNDHRSAQARAST